MYAVWSGGGVLRSGVVTNRDRRGWMEVGGGCHFVESEERKKKDVNSSKERSPLDWFETRFSSQRDR